MQVTSPNLNLTRAARWHILPKIPIWVNGRFWYILWLFGVFCGCLVYFVAIWYILCLFCIFCGYLVYFCGYLVYFCGYLVYFVAIWYILWLFGMIYGYLVYFSRLGMSYQEKYGIPEPNRDWAGSLTDFSPEMILFL
jgi:hypothetical protein